MNYANYVMYGTHYHTNSRIPHALLKAENLNYRMHSATPHYSN